MFNWEIFKKSALSNYKKYSKRKRYIPEKVSFFGKKIKIVDGPTFYSGYKEIFQKKIYEFVSEKENPLIIDCGSNIGLSIIFFKMLYPSSKVIAFEPDPVIFQALKENIGAFKFQDIQLNNKAVWVKEGETDFSLEGGYSGRILKGDEEGRKIPVPTVDLSVILEKNEVDFLKLDIEGAEYEVLLKCEHSLRNVKHIFVEYHSHFSEEQSLDEILSLFKRNSYRYQIQEAFVNKKPFVERKLMAGMDLQLNIFAYK